VASREIAIARPIPMKRELKANNPVAFHFESQIARPIPMKRELKVTVRLKVK